MVLSGFLKIHCPIYFVTFITRFNTPSLVVISTRYV